MRNASKVLIFAFGLAAFSGCHKKEAAASNSDLSIEDNLTSDTVPSNSAVETLPPDESSGTSSAELNKGDDNPDVNDLGNSN